MSDIVADAGSSGGSGAGDWTCGDSDCRHINFARRSKCKQCQRERSCDGSSGGGSSGGGMTKKKLGTEIGKAAAEKSRGLFSAEDWQCSKCANVNWARRQTCNMCNAPKFCDVEERTGYGGGYNDRGVVEYKEREESDSEYDEFGRLKKRKRRKESDTLVEEKILPKVKETKLKVNSNDGKDEEVVDDNDDDEEEEEDNGDLSKYDLWGDDEIASDSKSDKNKENSESSPRHSEKKRRSPSSSRSVSTSNSSRSTSSNSSYTGSSSSSSTSTNSRSSSPRERSRSRNTSLNRNSQYKASNLRQDRTISKSPNLHSSVSVKLKDRNNSTTTGKALTNRDRSRSPHDNYRSINSSNSRYRKDSRSRSVSSGKTF